MHAKMGQAMSATPENLIAILVMTAASMCAKGGGFIAMRWLGRYKFVMAWLQHAPGSVLVAAAIVPLVQVGGAYWLGAIVGALASRFLGGFTPGLFAAIPAVALARWAGVP
jgi:uncharacterized membrane protein